MGSINHFPRKVSVNDFCNPLTLVNCRPRMNLLFTNFNILHLIAYICHEMLPNKTVYLIMHAIFLVYLIKCTFLLQSISRAHGPLQFNVGLC